MCDYNSCEGFSDNDHQGNFGLIVDGDPLSYRMQLKVPNRDVQWTLKLKPFGKMIHGTSLIFLMAQK